MALPTPVIADVVDYLRDHGWTVTGRWRAADVWSRDEYDVLVPPSDTLADTAIRLRELIRCIADAEGLPERTIWRDITEPDLDIVTYRRADDTDPTVLLADGARALTALRDLVTHSAYAEVTNSPWRTPDSIPTRVRWLLRDTRLTACTGPFGFEVAIPADHEQSLGRRTAARLLDTATVVRAAARSADSSVVAGPLRHNLGQATVGALADLAGDGDDTAFALDFRWSRSAPRLDESVTFPTGIGPALRDSPHTVEREPIPTAPLDPLPLVAAPPPTEVGAVEGTVIGLSDDEHGDRWVVRIRGILRVDGVATGRTRAITVRLADAREYHVALAAHQGGKHVRAEGVVVDTGRTREITVAARGFTVLDQPPNPL
ncbi:hypothetical protein [Nocardia sp. NPDC060259]|uniref:hypothetical protein n=1 Tax=Nocardia sp. NPDC060259 TaxID=3347088 RepID=UPI0036667A8E